MVGHGAGGHAISQVPLEVCIGYEWFSTRRRNAAPEDLAVAGPAAISAIAICPIYEALAHDWGAVEGGKCTLAVTGASVLVTDCFGKAQDSEDALCVASRNHLRTNLQQKSK